MPIVKKIHARELLRSAVVLDLGDVGREAADLIEVARNEAESLLADARIEAARLTECAAEIGRAEGMALRRACGQALGPASRLSGGHPFGSADFRRAFRETGRLDSGVGQE